MGLAVYDGAAGLYIGHIKNLLVSSPGKAGFQLVPDRRACPVASSQKPCLAHLFQALGIACRDRYAIVLFPEVEQFGLTLNSHSHPLKMPNKQLLVPVLRIDQQKGVRRDRKSTRLNSSH